MILKTGDLAYIDGMRAVVPCKVLKITGTSGPASTRQEVTVRVTAARPGYALGQLVTEYGLRIVPRECVSYRTARMGRILAYNVEVT